MATEADACSSGTCIRAYMEKEERNRRRRKTEDGGRTCSTNSCVRITLGGFMATAEEAMHMAMWMTTSMSSFVGPEPASGGDGGAFVFMVGFEIVCGAEEVGGGGGRRRGQGEDREGAEAEERSRRVARRRTLMRSGRGSTSRSCRSCRMPSLRSGR